MVTLLRFVEYVEPSLIETELKKMVNRLTGKRKRRERSVQVWMTEEEYMVREECSIDRETTLSETIRYAIRNLAKRLGVKNAEDK